MLRSIAPALLVVLAACAEEITPLNTPSLDGPLTQGTWETRGRKGILFWPEGKTETRLPELIDFACPENTNGQVRFTVTGDTDQTGLWIAEDRRSSRTLILVTKEGATALDFVAGKQFLPSITVKTSAEWLQPLLAGEGRFAINAFGGRTYRLRATEDLAKAIRRCGDTG
ncbi:hypothetical protein [Parvularcula lutaonensis]|uniref:Uncharacterized protein n=1 Tax=Parvularcula lutaonensis TaxID=491923 RepID=A0ABV7MBH7_9PROT|nr:hypothetical protein [Parvularcula lutaonensis]GGY46920.1 hypothetical protein GCM10007148_15140 [Parvularcula lutaonensis]